MLANASGSRSMQVGQAIKKAQSVTELYCYQSGEGGIRTHGAREDTLVFKTKSALVSDWDLSPIAPLFASSLTVHC